MNGQVTLHYDLTEPLNIFDILTPRSVIARSPKDDEAI
jgi:hypothetical protein